MIFIYITSVSEKTISKAKIKVNNIENERLIINRFVGERDLSGSLNTFLIELISIDDDHSANII